MPLDRGAAWTALVEGGPVDGVVLATFRAAVYLRFGAEVVALVRADLDSGPLHARVATLPQPTAGTAVRLVGTHVRLGSAAVELPSRTWVPAPRADVLDAATALATWAGAPSSLALVSSPAAWPAGFREALAGGRLDDACRLVVGRGTGLTPAGDDVVAGVLLVHALAGADRGELLRIADTAPTHEISRAFLRWAARGQAVEPVHRLLRAAARRDAVGMRTALDRLDRLGHTSGRDLLAGVGVTLTTLSERLATTEAR